MSAAVHQHPRAVELVERARLRVKIERAVSRLLAILDDLDGDSDGEPWLGAPEVHERVPQWPSGSLDDRELDPADAEDGADAEESLGWPANVRQLALGHNTADGEPSLGSPENHHDQRRWADGAKDDREGDDAG